MALILSACSCEEGIVGYTTTVTNFMVCSFVTSYYKILALIHIHSFPQNIRHWPLHKSANNGITGPIWLPLWHWQSPLLTEIDTHLTFLSSKESKRKHMVQAEVSIESVEKRWPCFFSFQLHLGKRRAMCRGAVPKLRILWQIELHRWQRIL
jgi:hypothetical protein